MTQGNKEKGRLCCINHQSDVGGSALDVSIRNRGLCLITNPCQQLEIHNSLNSLTHHIYDINNIYIYIGARRHRIDICARMAVVLIPRVSCLYWWMCLKLCTSLGSTFTHEQFNVWLWRYFRNCWTAFRCTSSSSFCNWTKQTIEVLLNKVLWFYWFCNDIVNAFLFFCLLLSIL